jgi:hypothetical protein
MHRGSGTAGGAGGVSRAACGSYAFDARLRRDYCVVSPILTPSVAATRNSLLTPARAAIKRREAPAVRLGCGPRRAAGWPVVRRGRGTAALGATCLARQVIEYRLGHGNRRATQLSIGLKHAFFPGAPRGWHYVTFLASETKERIGALSIRECRADG